jgi:hypothetical protein
MTTLDRLADSIKRTVLKVLGVDPDAGPVPRLDRLAHYRARVNAASSDGKYLDVTPDDERIPPMTRVELIVGTPGQVAVVQPDCFVYVGWQGGNPEKPYCVPSWESGATVVKLVLTGQAVYIGGESGAQPIPLGDNLDARLQNIESLLASHTHGGVTPGLGSTGVTVGALPAPPNIKSNTGKVAP